MATLSKSKYTSSCQCQKKLWMEINKPECAVITDALEARFDTGHQVGDMARGLFGDFKSCVVNREDGSLDLGRMIRFTQDLMDAKTNTIAEASFAWDDCYCAVDLLHYAGNDEWELYEVKSTSTTPGDDKDAKKKAEQYMDDIIYQRYVLKNLGICLKSVNLVVMNADYTLPENKEIVLNDLFTIIPMDDYITLDREALIATKIDEARQTINSAEEVEVPLGVQCKKPYDCPFMKYCMDKRGIKYPSVFNLYRMQWRQKIGLLDKGFVTFEDVREVVKTETQKMQIECTLNGEDRIDKDGIRGFLNTLTYPLYFLDFETMQPAVPEFVGTHPYQQVPFQYSLHIKDSADSSVLRHEEFLGEPGEDPRRALAEKLCKDIPENACVMAYNKSFECTRIRELAQMYPDLANHLMKIEANIVDLMDPFQHCCYYTPAMRDSFSIKSVLPALFPDSEELNYHNLNESVQNGAQAMNVFPLMKQMNESERSTMRRALLDYCCLDTLAMVRVLEKLYEKSR